MIKKIITVVGARPQIIKSATVTRVFQRDYSDQIVHQIVHTGQHYDNEMSQIFFDELGIPQAQINLGIGSENHAMQVAGMMQALFAVFEKEKPNAILVYGDTNSTLAAALTGTKMNIPIFHIESGLRSFNKSMPEEINRILTDHVSTLLFAPTNQALTNLEKEGFNTQEFEKYSIDRPGVFLCGDVMYDNALHYRKLVIEKTDFLMKIGVHNQKFLLSTIHRDHNTDHPEILRQLFDTFCKITADRQISMVIPLHPRTKKMLDTPAMEDVKSMIKQSDRINIIPPVSYLEMLCLISNAKMILTDSGGLQKEAFFFQKPCIILRPETEWTELVKNGNARITGCDPEKIKLAINHYYTEPELTWPSFYGDGHAAEFICDKISHSL